MCNRSLHYDDDDDDDDDVDQSILSVCCVNIWKTVSFLSLLFPPSFLARLFVSYNVCAAC